MGLQFSRVKIMAALRLMLKLSGGGAVRLD